MRNRGLSAVNDLSLYEVFEFSDVAGPWVPLEIEHEMAGKRSGPLIELFVVFIDQITREVREVVNPLAQRAELQVYNVDAIKQILAEGTRSDVICKVPIGCTHNANVDLCILSCPEATELAFL
jgi:hypothetical protein